MPTDITRLQQLVTEAAGEVAARWADNPARFMREMEAIIVRAHTAATIGAIQDRTGVAPKGLSRAERADLQAQIAAQRPYLQGFAEAVRAGMDEAAIARRAELYAGPVRTTYSEQRWYGAGLPAHPGQGTACKAWCKCQWVQQDDGYYWMLGASEHCGDCQSRAAQWAPYRVEAA